MRMRISQINKSYLLIAILLAAAILRFDRINQPFIDVTTWRESDTATIADNFYRGNWNILYPEISWNGPGQNYVGYEFQTLTYITAMLYRLFGQHDWVGRTVTALFGLWSIFAFYQLVRRVWDEKHAFASATFLAILPGNIYIDRSFVPDPVMVSLVVTSFWLLVAYLQTERLYYLLLATLIGMLGFLTKITGIFVGIPMLIAIITILGHKRMLRSKQLSLICVATIVMFVPVIAYYLWAHYISFNYPPYHIAASGNWLWSEGLSKWLQEKYFLEKLFWILRDFWTKPVIILVFVGLLLRPDLYNRDDNKAPWLFHWWIVAIVIYYLIGAKQLVDNRTNLNIINPAAAALAGHAVIAIARSCKRRVGYPATVAFMAAIILFIGGFGYQDLKGIYYQPTAEKDYKLGLALRSVSQPGDLVVTIAHNIGNPVAIYYSQRRGWVFPPAWKGVVWWADDDMKNNSKTIRLLEELRAKGADWLGIVNDQKIQLSKDNPKFFKYIERTFEVNQESPDYIIYRISPDKRLPSKT